MVGHLQFRVNGGRGVRLVTSLRATAESRKGHLEVAPKLQAGGLRVIGLLFELLRTPITLCLMQALSVIEALDVLEDGLTGLGVILELPMPDQLILERSKTGARSCRARQSLGKGKEKRT